MSPMPASILAQWESVRSKVVQYDFDPISTFTQSNCPGDNRVGKRHRGMYEVAHAAFNDVVARESRDTRTAMRAKSIAYR